MFIDKGKLLFQLNQQYQKGGIQIVSLYAHPGMGKTRLLQEFSKEKQVLYFKASPYSMKKTSVYLKIYVSAAWMNNFKQQKNSQKFSAFWQSHL